MLRLGTHSFFDVLFYNATVEQMHASFRITGESGIMGDHAYRGAFLMQAAQQVHDSVSILRVEIPRRLVRKQNGGFAAQRSSHRHALLLAARKLRRVMFHPVRHSNFLQGFAHALFAFCPVRSPIGQRKLNILEDG